MPEQQFKRQIAYKSRIGDLLIGKPIFDGEKFSFLELGNKKIVRVNIIGNVIDKYDSEGEKQYSFITIDDGSGQIKAKAFGDNAQKLKDLTQGQTILLIGVLRNWNNETYINPEIVREQDPKYLLVRKLELEKEKSDIPQPLAKEQVIAIKDKLLDKIKSSEESGGIGIDKLILECRETSPDIINSEVKKLIEEGIIFEPSPGKVRWLG